MADFDSEFMSISTIEIHGYLRFEIPWNISTLVCCILCLAGFLEMGIWWVKRSLGLELRLHLIGMPLGRGKEPLRIHDREPIHDYEEELKKK